MARSNGNTKTDQLQGLEVQMFHKCMLWMMTIYSDILHWSGITPILTLLLILTLLPNLTFYLIARGFHRTFATGAACQQRTLTPPDTWSCPTLGLASVLMLRPISPELVLFLDFWVSNFPRYFCFCFDAGMHYYASKIIFSSTFNRMELCPRSWKI